MRLVLYYDNTNYINPKKYYNEILGQNSPSAIHLENGVRTEFLDTGIPVESRPICLRLYVQGRQSRFEWSYDREKYGKIGCIFGTARFPDERCRYREFTVTMVDITYADRIKYAHYTDFGFLEYVQEQGE